MSADDENTARENPLALYVERCVKKEFAEFEPRMLAAQEANANRVISHITSALGRVKILEATTKLLEHRMKVCEDEIANIKAILHASHADTIPPESG